MEFFCPDCTAKLKKYNKFFKCVRCRRFFPVSDGILCLLPSNLSREKIAEINLYKCPHGFEQKAIKELLSHPTKLWKYIPHEIFRFEKEILEKTLFKGKVLELGSGLGWGSLLIKRKFPAVTSYITDISDTVLVSAKRFAESLDLRINFFVQCDAEKLPFPDNYFDFIFSWALIHHLPAPVNMLFEVMRVLKPMGCFIAGAEPCVSPLAKKLLGGSIIKILTRREIFAYAQKRSEIYGILENTYTFEEWYLMLRTAGIENFIVDLNNTWSRGMSLSRLCYNNVTQLMPKSFVKRYLAASINIRAQKN